jgi:hypothetical protein
LPLEVKKNPITQNPIMKKTISKFFALGAIVLASSHLTLAATLTGQLFTGGTSEKIPIKNVTVTLYETTA